MCAKIFKITDNLSRTLQAKSLSAAESYHLAEMTVTTLEGMRTEEAFELFFDRLEILRQELSVEEPSLPRRKKPTRRFEYGDGKAYHSDTVAEYYRRQYFEVLDLAATSIKSRFDQPGYAMYSKLETVLLKGATQQDFSSEVEDVVSLYKDDVDKAELTTQLEIMGATLEKEEKSIKTTHELIHYLQSLTSGQRSLLSQVCKVARLLLVLPATNATSEQSFSTLRRLKSYLRNTMCQARLNHVMTLNVYKELLNKLDLRVVAADFVGSSEHRLSVFGTFV